MVAVVVAVMVAVVAAALVVGGLMLFDRSSSDRSLPRASGWVSFVSGTVGLLAVATPVVDSWLAPDGVDRLGEVAAWLYPASMTLGLVGLMSAIYALVRRDRSWRMWVGLVTGGLVVVFWLVFAVGELTFPH